MKLELDIVLNWVNRHIIFSLNYAYQYDTYIQIDINQKPKID